jgi:hypothetical protein
LNDEPVLESYVVAVGVSGPATISDDTAELDDVPQEFTARTRYQYENPAWTWLLTDSDVPDTVRSL